MQRLKLEQRSGVPTGPTRAAPRAGGALRLATSAFAICAALAALACFGASESERARELYARGLRYETNGSLLRAREQYVEAIRLDRRFAEAHVGQGRVLLRTGNARAAQGSADRALQLNERMADAHHLRGDIYAALGDYEPAILSFTRAIEVDPSYAEAYYSRAKVNLQDGNYDAAIDDLSAAIHINPHEPLRYMERARLYASLDQTERALRDLERVLEVSQDQEITSAARNMIAGLTQSQ